MLHGNRLLTAEELAKIRSESLMTGRLSCIGQKVGNKLATC